MRILVSFAIILSLGIAFSGCITYIPCLSPPVVYPRIIPEQGESRDSIVTHTFLFGDSEITIAVPVDTTVYQGAQGARKTVTIYDEGIRDAEWKAGLYRTMIEDPAQDRFYSAFISALRRVKEERNLDSDQYLELIAVCVQSVPYKTVENHDPKYPLETFADREGDCDDKSMLLAALLAREGYAAALLSFEPENHMAVGVACPGYSYRDCGYAFLESTNVTLVGVSGGSLEGNVTLHSDPLVIPLGKGTIQYTSCNETHSLWEEVERIRRELELLAAELGENEAELRRIHADLDEMEIKTERLKALGQVHDYNLLVSPYNNRVQVYNSLLAEYRSGSARQVSLANRYNFIITHQHDRTGTYRTIFSR
jgi:hypothetical protein